MSDTLTAKEQSLGQIFSDEYVFTIPSYQRPYSWGEDQAQELLDDLSSAVSAAPSDLKEAQPYFLGSIVLIKAKGSPEATVVDGQQRLTTLTLLLSALRESISNPDIQRDVTSCIYEKGNLAKGTKARYRLSLRDRDRDFFKDNVQHENTLKTLAASSNKLPDAQSRLRVNGTFFLKELSVRSQDELLRLVQFIMIRCYLVSVSTPDLDSAYRIFGVLNSRGLDLSATDILKAEVIGAIDDEMRDVYTTKWEDQEERLGRDEFSDLFSHIRMVYRKAKSQGTLLKEFREHVAPTVNPQNFMNEILLPMADAYGDIREANYESNKLAEEVNECLKWLNRLEFKDWMPPALAYFVRHRKNPEAMLQFFKDLERLGYSMLARKTGVNNRIDRFSTLTDAIEDELDLYSLGSPLQLTPTEQFETYAALNGPLYETHSARALAVLLMRVDRLLSDASAEYQHEVVSVEHVMPQQPAPNSKWLKWVPDLEKHQSWVHRLGNLTLLSRKKNSAASNYEFEKKKTAYFTKSGVTSFALTTQVLSFNEWTEDILQSRQTQLLTALDKHWRLQDRLSKQQLAEKLLTELASACDGVTFELIGIRHGLAAYAKDDGRFFTVLKGSMARVEWRGQPHSYQQLRDDLVASAVLVSSADGRCLVFAQDQVFKSPSAASATVLGRTDNGRNSWRLKGSAITYAAWQDNLPEDQLATGRFEG
jgi:Protein of unknown function DUF262/Protein of unknown function (DUF1524)/Domain of unknown function (DUF4357)